MLRHIWLVRKLGGVTSPGREDYPEREAMAWRGDLPVQPVERALLECLEVTEAPILEAGVGHGRLLAVLAKAGFTNLHGFDLALPALKAGRQRGSLKDAFVTVQDARAVAYRDGSFRHVVYLQQLLSFMGDEMGWRAAASHAYRVLQPGGTALFSFLSLASRRASVQGWLLVVYIRVLRFVLRRNTPISNLPWLRVGGRINWRALLDKPPHAHYFVEEEAAGLLRSVGFIDVRDACISIDRQLAASSAIYLICTKLGPTTASQGVGDRRL
jgi:SAM-dependent methyltransferase